jgi:hypothetical protein
MIRSYISPVATPRAMISSLGGQAPLATQVFNYNQHMRGQFQILLKLTTPVMQGWWQRIGIYFLAPKVFALIFGFISDYYFWQSSSSDGLLGSLFNVRIFLIQIGTACLGIGALFGSQRALKSIEEVGQDFGAPAQSFSLATKYAVSLWWTWPAWLCGVLVSLIGALLSCWFFTGTILKYMILSRILSCLDGINDNVASWLIIIWLVTVFVVAKRKPWIGWIWATSAIVLVPAGQIFTDYIVANPIRWIEYGNIQLNEYISVCWCVGIVLCSSLVLLARRKMWVWAASISIVMSAASWLFNSRNMLPFEIKLYQSETLTTIIGCYAQLAASSSINPFDAIAHQQFDMKTTAMFVPFSTVQVDISLWLYFIPVILNVISAGILYLFISRVLLMEKQVCAS